MLVSSPHVSKPKLQYIDALRGIAILMVVLVHVSQQMPGLPPVTLALLAYGQMGVQLFFVVSAYTLCESWKARAAEPYQIRSFYLRRYFRIAPLYYLAIPLYWLYRVIINHLQGGVSTGQFSATNILANLLFVHSFYAPAANDIVPGGWSVGTEVAFYLVFPLLFLLAERINRFGLVAWITLILLALAGDIAWQIHVVLTTHNNLGNNSFWYLHPINQLPVFLIGLYSWFRSRDQRIASPGIWRAVIAFAGFVAFTSAAFWLWHFPFPLMFALVPTTSALSFLCLLSFMRRLPRQGWLLRAVGRVSYSIYIFHFIVVYTCSWAILQHLQGMLPGEQLVFLFILDLGGAFIIASLSERFIERPGIRLGRRMIERMQPMVGVNPSVRTS